MFIIHNLQFRERNFQIKMDEVGVSAIKSKRSRAPNYTNAEKETLLNIILDYKDIIENKRTDGVSVQEKKETWTKIAEQFNTASPNMVPRQLDSLRKYYEHVKEDIRKRAGNLKKELYKTGGGTIKDISKESTDDLLLSIINNKTVFGLESQYDCDNCDSSIDKQKKSHNEELVFAGNIDKDTSENRDLLENETGSMIEIHYETNNIEKKDTNYLAQESERRTDWGKVSTSNLRTPKNKILKENIGKVYSSSHTLKRKNEISRRRPTIVRTLTSSKLAEKYENLLDKKLELVECYKKEHSLRMEILALDITLKKKQLNLPFTNYRDSNNSLVDSDIMF